MKATAWSAAGMLVVTALVFMIPFTLTGDSEGAAWFALLVMLVTWYFIGPFLLLITTMLAATASAFFVSDRKRRMIGCWVLVGGWLALLITEVVVAALLLPKPHAASTAHVNAVFIIVLSVTGLAFLTVGTLTAVRAAKNRITS